MLSPNGQAILDAATFGTRSSIFDDFALDAADALAIAESGAQSAPSPQRYAPLKAYGGDSAISLDENKPTIASKVSK